MYRSAIHRGIGGGVLVGRKWKLFVIGMRFPFSGEWAEMLNREYDPPHKRIR
jgi:hypothetical protein